MFGCLPGAPNYESVETQRRGALPTPESYPTMSDNCNRATHGPFEVQLEDVPSSDTAVTEIQAREQAASSGELPERQYDCEHYEKCLGLAASLNWESFTCQGCEGAPSEHLLWRARTTARKDTVAARLLRAAPLVALRPTLCTNEGDSDVASTSRESQ